MCVMCRRRELFTHLPGVLIFAMAAVPPLDAAVASQLSWMAAAEEEVALDDLAALIKETCGVLEKLAVSVWKGRTPSGSPAEQPALPPRV